MNEITLDWPRSNLETEDLEKLQRVFKPLPTPFRVGHDARRHADGAHKLPGGSDTSNDPSVLAAVDSAYSIPDAFDEAGLSPETGFVDCAIVDFARLRRARRSTVLQSSNATPRQYGFRRAAAPKWTIWATFRSGWGQRHDRRNLRNRQASVVADQ